MRILVASKILAQTEHLPPTSEATEVPPAALAVACCNRPGREQNHRSRSADRRRLSQGQVSVTVEKELGEKATAKEQHLG